MLEIVKKSLRGNYFWLFVLWFLLLIGFGIYINQWHVVGSLFFNLPWWIVYPFLTLFLLNNFLASLSINLAIIRIKTLQKALSAGGSLGVSFVGTFFGILGGACPGCIAGLFPVIAGLFGSRFALSQLPLYGMEIQIIGTALLLFGIYLLSKPIVCKVK